MSISQSVLSQNIDQPVSYNNPNIAHLHTYSPSLLDRFNNFTHHISSHHYYPRFDIEEHRHTYELYGDLPGAQRASLKILTHNEHIIEISGSTGRYHGEGKTSELTQTEVIDSSGPFVEIMHKEAAPPMPSYSTATYVPAINITNGTNMMDGCELARSPKHDSEEAKLSEPKEMEVKYLITERQHGAFHRIFTFSNPIKEKEVTAKFDNGILHIKIPKGPAPLKNEVGIYWGGAMF